MKKDKIYLKASLTRNNCFQDIQATAVFAKRNHTLFILHIFTCYNFLRILLFQEIWILLYSFMTEVPII